MSQQNELSLLTFRALCDRCHRESERFFAQQEHDPRFCYELFRRAFVHGNELAWDCLYHRYQKLVLSWVTRHALYASLGEEANYFMNRAFEKMWQGIPADNFAKFPDLKSLLRYLQMCTHAVMVDFARWKEQAHLWDRAAQTDNGDDEFDPFATIMDPNTRPEREVARQEMQAILWQRLNDLCNSEKEHLVVHGYFVLDLKPRQIYEMHGEHFADVREVSRTKDNFLARVRRNDEFREFLENA
ncbi:sigma-70 family RNA polymerase sigma factor [Candidatus Leptofilum sp.]|uniref:sigma-70 family RNA polymerase sigma factor n=1 Tax=Candidatus Leptofilum sp. TaxID=3241576 RepID=UPI003B58BA23